MKLLNNAVIRLTKNRKPAYDPENELMWDRTYNSSSWFVIGHFEAEGHKLNYLYHQMVWQDKDGSLKLNSVIGVTDETTGEYLGEDKFYPMDQTKFAEDHFGIIVPNGSMEGDLRNMRVTAFMEHASLDLELEFEDGIIMNGGAGEFSIAVIGVKQYSKPRIKPTGTLVLNGKTYPISGDAWFDRQWQKVPTQKSKTGEGSDDPVTGGTIHWYWMDLNMDNGDKLSLWCVEIAKITRAWATVLHADGTNKVVDVTPFTQFKAKKWYSQASGQNYPIEFTVEIKDLDAKLYVAPYPVELEIVSEHISKYEAASQVKGTYLGKPATGFCYVELVGGFK